MLKAWWTNIKQIPYLDVNWLIIWISIYLSFIFLDIAFPGWPVTSLLKYIGIFLCVVYVFTKYHSDLMLILALLFTFIADTILIWTSWTVAGVYIFSLAQLMHFLRLCKARLEYIFAWVAIASFVFAIAIIQGCIPIYAIAIIYTAILLSNFYLAANHFQHHKSDFKARCAYYGFASFVCCDICVTIRFLSLGGLITTTVIPVLEFWVWLFYYPSQVLIANSSTMPLSLKVPKNLRNKSV